MSIFDVVSNVVKAGVAVVVTPVALATDFVTLPSSALNGRGPFPRTGKMLDAAGDAITAAVKPGDK